MRKPALSGDAGGPRGKAPLAQLGRPGPVAAGGSLGGYKHCRRVRAWIARPVPPTLEDCAGFSGGSREAPGNRSSPSVPGAVRARTVTPPREPYGSPPLRTRAIPRVALTDRTYFLASRARRTPYRTPHTTHHAPHTTHHTPRTAHRAPRTTHRAPHTTHHTPRTAHHAPRTAHRAPRTFHATTVFTTHTMPAPRKKMTGNRHPFFPWNSGTRLDAPT